MGPTAGAEVSQVYNSQLIFLLLSIAVCTLHLCLGIWIGYEVRRGKIRAQARATNQATQRALTALNSQLSQATSVSQQSKALGMLCDRHPALPPAITSAVKQLTDAIEALKAHIQTANEVFSAQRVPEPKPICRPSSSAFGLTREELDRITRGAENPQASAEFRTQRYRYSAHQFIAPFDDGMAQPENFKSARCHDLSSGGVSFFVEEAPAYESVVISLGSPPELKFFVAKVEHSHTVFMYESLGYLVGCRFIKRLDGLYRWDKASNKIVLARQPRGEVELAAQGAKE